MKSAFTLSMLAVAFLLLSSTASAQPGDLRLIREVLPPSVERVYVDMLTGRVMSISNWSRPSVARAVPKPVWKIPAGKFGLQLNNGTRIIGQPAKGWSATLKTSFGTVTIPLAQITRLEPTGKGQFSAYLKTGDRVTGVLVSKVLSFETAFGTMTVPTQDLVRLCSATPAKRSSVPARTSTTRKRVRKLPGLPDGAPAADDPAKEG